MALEATHAITEPSDFTQNETRRRMSRGAAVLDVSDNEENTQVIYIYNTLNLEHTIWQPPLFPAVFIPPCDKGKLFSFTIIPRYVNERFERPGTNEYYYKRVDGRKCATSLLNPSVHPSNSWESQFRTIKTHGDQFGNNYNELGVFWSLTPPDSPALGEEIGRCKDRVRTTMNRLMDEGETFAAANDRKSITPLMHFAMDWLGMTASWHMSHAHMTTCPNCGDQIRDGLAYHRNSFNEKCVIDWKRAYDAGAIKKADVPEGKEWWTISSVTLSSANSTPIEGDVEITTFEEEPKPKKAARKPR